VIASGLPVAASSEKARENRKSPVNVAPAAEGSSVEHVVVDERGHVHQLDGDRGPDGVLTHRVARAEEHDQRAQPLAAGAERVRRVAAQLLAVARPDGRQALLAACEGARQARASGGEHRLEPGQAGSLPGRHAHDFTPRWIAMIPPAVTTQRTRSSPAAARRPASSSGPGKRRTELGR
jgi:hypothetical protein